jgi:luciferase family oxidoreductase group 1
LKINILDQSPVIESATPAESIAQTIELAKFADESGFHRYWVSEHHSSNSFASASPEILVSAIASVTEKIKAGSAGVLINHYSPLKIAEQFNVMESLFPGRIDLGIGRAPGGDAGILKALRTPVEDSFKKTDELIEILLNSSKNQFSESPVAVPCGIEIPEIWILGTSPESAFYAAERGLRYVFGSFISDEYMIKCFETYYQNFKPSVFLKTPYLNLALFAICGRTQSEADRIARCSEYWITQSFLKKRNIKFPNSETAEKYNFTFEEKLFLEYRRKSAIIADTDTVCKKIKDLIKKYALHEITIVTITSDFTERKLSYSLISENLLN